MASKPNHEALLAFEQSFLRIPFENYRKITKTAQKYIERDLGAIQGSANDLVKASDNGNMNVEDTTASIDAMIVKVESLKDKLNRLNDKSGNPTLFSLQKRIDHVQELEAITAMDSSAYEQWTDKRLDRWLVDWALRTGKPETARSLAKAKEIEHFVDIEIFAEIQRIEKALQNHSCTEALAWCNENKISLRKTKSTLEFDLRLQEYIELARVKKHKEAMAYFRKHLTSWKETQEPLIIHCTSLLYASPSSNYKPYKRLYSNTRWDSLQRSFRQTAYTLSSLPHTALLHQALYGGLAALKLPACYDPASRNTDCPVCDPEGLGVLAKEVPFSHHVNSTIVCRLSGMIMNEDNPPMVFPDNGYVYSRNALQDMASKNNGIVTCPRSGASCPYALLRKVYIS